MARLRRAEWAGKVRFMLQMKGNLIKIEVHLDVKYNIKDI